MTDNKRKKTTSEQRLLMLQFMEEHNDLAQNRVKGLDAKKRATTLWNELADILNNCGNGATKSPDKWIKSWRDWRVDTKAKAAKIKNYQRGTGGGGPSPAALQEIEERLIALMGIESVKGHTNIIDPAELENFTSQYEDISESPPHHFLSTSDLVEHQDNPLLSYPFNSSHSSISLSRQETTSLASNSSQSLAVSTCSSKLCIKSIKTYPHSSISLSRQKTISLASSSSQSLPVSTCSSKSRITNIETYPHSSISFSQQKTTSLASSSSQSLPVSTCSSKSRITNIETYPHSSISFSQQETTLLASISSSAIPPSSSSINLNSSNNQHRDTFLPASSKEPPRKRQKQSIHLSNNPHSSISFSQQETTPLASISPSAIPPSSSSINLNSSNNQHGDTFLPASSKEPPRKRQKQSIDNLTI